jgi:hypothetical protein
MASQLPYQYDCLLISLVRIRSSAPPRNKTP